MNSELPASPPGVMVEVARGADLNVALLRARFFAGTTVFPVGLAELASFESAWGRLLTVFFGAFLNFVALLEGKVESESLLTSAREYMAEKLEQAESESS